MHMYMIVKDAALLVQTDCIIEILYIIALAVQSYTLVFVIFKHLADMTSANNVKQTELCSL